MKISRHTLIAASLCFLILNSCSSLKMAPQGNVIQEKVIQEKVIQENVIKDTFSRTYSAEFTSFHPRINTALQDYAQKNKGNAFQVVRLGGDAVVIRGRFKRDSDSDRFFATLTAKPSANQKTALQIKISSSKAEASTAYLEKAAEDLFRIVEIGSGIPLKP